MLWMLERYLGRERFRSGVRRYLAAHEYANTETTDLWDAIEAEAGGEPIRELMDSWIFQGGYPLVSADPRTTVRSRSPSNPSRTCPLSEAGPGGSVDRTGLARPGHRPAARSGRRRGWPQALLPHDPRADQGTERIGGAERRRRGLLSPAARCAAIARAPLGAVGSLGPAERYNLVADTWAAVLAGIGGLAELPRGGRGPPWRRDRPERVVGGHRGDRHARSRGAGVRSGEALSSFVGGACLSLGLRERRLGRRTRRRTNRPRCCAPRSSERSARSRRTPRSSRALPGARASRPSRGQADAGRHRDRHRSAWWPRTPPGPSRVRGDSRALAPSVRKPHGRDPQPVLLGRRARSSSSLGSSTSSAAARSAARTRRMSLAACCAAAQVGPAAFEFIEAHIDELAQRFPDNSIHRMLDITGLAELDDDGEPVYLDKAATFCRAHVPGARTLLIEQTIDRTPQAVNVRLARAVRAWASGICSPSGAARISRPTVPVAMAEAKRRTPGAGRGHARDSSRSRKPSPLSSAAASASGEECDRTAPRDRLLSRALHAVPRRRSRGLRARRHRLQPRPPPRLGGDAGRLAAPRPRARRSTDQQDGLAPPLAPPPRAGRGGGPRRRDRGQIGDRRPRLDDAAQPRLHRRRSHGEDVAWADYRGWSPKVATEVVSSSSTTSSRTPPTGAARRTSATSTRSPAARSSRTTAREAAAYGCLSAVALGTAPRSRRPRKRVRPRGAPPQRSSWSPHPAGNSLRSG